MTPYCSETIKKHRKGAPTVDLQKSLKEIESEKPTSGSVDQSGDVGRSENLGVGRQFYSNARPFKGEFLGCMSAAQHHSFMLFPHLRCCLVVIVSNFEQNLP